MKSSVVILQDVMRTLQCVNTRHYIATILVLIIPAWRVCPQSVQPFSLRFGIASTNQSVTLYNGNAISSSKRLVVPDISLLIDLFASNHFSFVTGFEYQQRGIGESIPYFNTELLEANALNFKFHYLSLPLLARYRNRLGAFTPYAISGFNVNYSPDSWAAWLAFDATFALGIRTDGIFPLPIFVEGRYSVDLSAARDQSLDMGYKRIDTNLFDIAIGIIF